jgi:protein TonB
MHDILQANQDVPPALKALGASGTAYVEITVAPDGHVVTARISKSSGNPLIDQTALDHALHANFGAFNAGMPDSAVPFTIPVEIDAEDDADGGDDGN